MRKSGKIYSRPDDMSNNQELRLMAQNDGDCILEIINIDTMERMQVELCLSGGRSFNSLAALKVLIEAMIQDEKERPCRLFKLEEGE